MPSSRLRRLPLALFVMGSLCWSAAQASSHYAAPRGALAGLDAVGSVDPQYRLHLTFEFQPRDPSLEQLAFALADPASPLHRATLTREQFVSRFARPAPEVEALAATLKALNASDVYISTSRLVIGADMTVAQASRYFHATFVTYKHGARAIVAPTGPVTIPADNIRAVRGLIATDSPELADTIALPNDFRGGWFSPARVREAYDAIPDGGTGARLTLIEDASDRHDPADLPPFIRGEGALPDGPPDFQIEGRGRGRGRKPGPEPSGSPPAVASSGLTSRPQPFGAAVDRIYEKLVAFSSRGESCGRDDRGQEPTMDLDAAVTMAPGAIITVQYDRICERGGDGSLAIQRALDDPDMPNAIAFPFVVAALYGPERDAFGSIPLSYLEAAVLGVPLVVPSGDDGAYGIHDPEIEQAAVTYPCVLPIVICAGGTQLGERSGALDEGPWNDGVHAGGGGISLEPRPAWQNAPSGFEFSPGYIKNRVVPDVSADASGHLLVYWHGYGEGGVGGTSESTAIVAAELTAINAAVSAPKRIIGPADLYTLANAHPTAFRDVVRVNDRSIDDNTLHPKPPTVPPGFTGALPTTPPTVYGCAAAEARGCTVRKGFDAVTGIGSLKEQAAVNALTAP